MPMVLYSHANSIDAFPNGDYLVSGRRTNAVYRISRKTGSVIWCLGGRRSDFQEPVVFSGQHAANVYEHNDTHTVLSFLDNAYLPPGVPQTTNRASRGLLLALDTTAMTATLISEFAHPDGEYAKSRGNMQMLPSTNAWICRANGSLQSDHTFDGTLVTRARFKAKISSYRSFKFPWTGRPKDPPDVYAAVVEKSGQWYTVVHMSWNGATEVRDWNVYHTDAESTERKLVAKVPKQGFETLAWTEGYREYVLVEALDKDGVALGVSRVFASLPPRNGSRPTVESSFDTEKESWLHAMVSNSFITFTFGVLLGVLIFGALAWAVMKWSPAAKYGGSDSRWKQSKELYEPLIVEREEQDLELDAFDDVVQAGKYEAEGAEPG